MDGRCAAATLGADRNANKDDVRRAFRARAKELHPDSGPNGSESAFIALRQAFDVLMATAPDAAQPTASPQGSRVTSPLQAPRFETSAPKRRANSVDLADAERRPGGRADRRTSPVRQADPQSTARGMIFADHLAAAMAG